MTLFASTYISEQTFSFINFRKDEFCSKLTDEHLHQQLKIATTNLKPNTDRLSEDITPQTSH